MKKITLFKSLFVALVLSVFSSSLFAEDVISNTFTSTTMQAEVQTYTDTWDNVSGTTLTLTAFNNNKKGWTYVKCGRKADASVATIKTKYALTEKVTKVVVTVDNVLDASKVNATYLEVATDAAFTQNVQKITATIAKGAVTYNVTTPAENCFYRLTFDCASHGSKNGIIQISKVDFYYEAAVAPAVEKPVLSVAEGVKEEAFNLEMTCATAGADIYYTLNGGAETKYTAAINIAKTTEVKAFAVKGQDTSAVVSATYTFIEYIENATIAQVLAAKESDYVWYKMTGVIDSLYNTTYGNFYFVDETDTIVVYGLTATKQSSNDKSFASLGLVEGDKITIWGTRSAYKGTAQVGGPAYFVEKVVAPSITASWDIEAGDTLKGFTEITVTFTGVEKATTTSMYPICFYSVAEDGTAAPVENYCTAGMLDRTASGASIKFWVDEESGCYTGKITSGKYRILLPAGTVKFNGADLSTVDYSIDFIVESDVVVVPGVDAIFTVDPANNSTVSEIKEIVLNFSEYDSIKVAEPDLVQGTNIPVVYSYLPEYDMTMPAGYMMFKADTLSKNGLRLYIDPAFMGGLESINIPGEYMIEIPSGVVTFADGINKDIVLFYTVAEAKEELPDTVRFANIAAIYEKGIWEEERYANYTSYSTIAILESQPTVVDVVKTSGRMGGGITNYYLNDGTGVIVMRAEGDRYEPVVDDDWNVIGYDTIYGLNIEVGKKLPAEFYATIDFHAVIDDETYLPTGAVYGAPIMEFMPKVVGTEVDEWGWESNITEPYDTFVARCEASDFVETVVEADLLDVLANRIKYAGQLLKVDATANYYASTEMDHFSGAESTTAYIYYGDVESAFDVESYEDGDVTYVYVSPKFTEDNYNYAGQVFNVLGAENLPAAALDAKYTMTVGTVRFDWNAISMGQSIILKEGWEVKDNQNVDVENNELVVNIYSNNGAVYVEAEAGAMIEVYTVNGLRVFAGVSNTNTTVINGLNNVAIIRVNGEAYKVFVK